VDNTNVDPSVVPDPVSVDTTVPAEAVPLDTTVTPVDLNVDSTNVDNTNVDPSVVPLDPNAIDMNMEEQQPVPNVAPNVVNEFFNKMVDDISNKVAEKINISNDFKLQNGFTAVNNATETMATTGGKRSKFRLTHKNKKTRSKKTRSKK
jgi:hypothetical protein